MNVPVHPEANQSDDWRLLADTMRVAVEGNQYWGERLASLPDDQTGLHLAILIEPYLGYVLAGKKTVESRFAMRRGAPYGRVYRGDVLLLKRSGGPIVGVCEVTDVWFYHLDLSSWGGIRETFSVALCAQDPTFWQDRAAASFATLMRITSVLSCQPTPYAKRDRRGWVVLKPALPLLKENP